MIQRYLLLHRVWLLIGCLLAASVAGYAQPTSEGRVPDAIELAALRALYNSTNGPNWTNHTNWLTGTTMADAAKWYGVSVYNDDVTNISLNINNLSGSLPAELGQLTELNTLQLLINRITGALPVELSKLTKLRLAYLSVNQFSGPLPAELGELTELREFQLSDNRFSGSLPAELGNLAKLEVLNLSRNSFSGAIPVKLGQLTRLGGLSLADNQFSGALPSSLVTLPLLRQIDVQNNKLTGLPSFQQNPNLSYFSLNVSNNQLGFEALEPNFTGPGQSFIKNITYSPQISSTDEQVTTVVAGGSFTLRSDIGGARTRYQWQREVAGNWVVIAGATSANFQVAQATAQRRGRYRCRATNDWVTGLTLYSRLHRVNITKVPPPSDPSADLDRNWTFSRTYDLAGNITSESKQFSDGMGRPTQSQSKNLAERHVFATQTLHSSNGVAVLTTLPASTNNQEFKYKKGFVTATTSVGGGAPVSRDYAPVNFEKPTSAAVATDPLDETTPGTLGYYYSTNNTWEPAIAATRNPFSISEPMPGPLGGMRRAAGPGDEFRLGSGHEMRGRDFPLLNEMDHYSQLRARFVPGSPVPSLRAQGLKSVSISPNGIESISFADREGNVLASCLSGDQYPASTLAGNLTVNMFDQANSSAYQDIHVAKSATPTTITVTDGRSTTPSLFAVTDLSRNPSVITAYSGTTTFTLTPGFYRLQVTDGSISFSYPVRYGDFSYVFYDDAGRAVASIAPKGVAELLPTGLNTGLNVAPKFLTRNVFDTSGQLLSTTSTDEGTTRYVYARDGRIRFSQSARQAQGSGGTAPRFSYSNYDRLGRVVESGEYTQATTPGQGVVFEDMLTATPAANSVLQPALLEDRTATGGLDAAFCSQRNQVWYDVPQPDAALGSRQQDFVLGAVAKTSNGLTTTWYSYNDLGQLTWLVQKAPVVGVKTVDYTYDAAGNVTQVAYQKGQPDAFYHYNTYDENQRLLTVKTSPDGITQTEQARYVYYLHGPLKRVETASGLQGTDYTYTVQGWLKSINGANRRLDGDSPTASGFVKDLFGLTLDYFSGDYRSAQASLATPTIANAPAPRYDGLVRSAAWFTVANPAMRQHVYTYDAKSQLKQATFGQLVPGSTPTAPGSFVAAIPHANEEGNMEYDMNGNLNKLRRYDGAGVVTDDFTYQYAFGSNKLARVNNPAGAAVLDYDYDATGQMIRQRDEQGQRYLTYDVTGKVTGVYRDAAYQKPLVVFTYDDRGFRASKASYDPITFQLKRTTYSVRDASGNELSTYVQEAAGSLTRTEVPLYGASRLGTLTRLDDGSEDYRYELNDQLGNARVIYHQPTTTTYTATMEPSASSKEQQDFANVATTRFMAPGHNGSAAVARLGLTAGLSTGPSQTLTVAKGDTVTFTAYAWLTAAVASRTAPPQGKASRLVPLVGLAAPLSSAAVRTDGRPVGGLSALSGLRLGAAFTLGSGKLTSALPAQQRSTAGGFGNAQLHYIVRDDKGAIIQDDYQRATPGNAGSWQQLQVGLRLGQGGTVELRVETDGAGGPDVYFDDIQVDYTSSTIVQEQHSSAYGSPLVGLNYTVGNKNYRHGYQGQFTEKDEETGWDNFELRMYDSRIGRWTAPDPEGQFDSPYVGMGNNPVSSVDPDGGFSGIPFIQILGRGLVHESYRLVVNWGVLGNALKAVGSAVGRAVVSAAPYALQAGASNISYSTRSAQVPGVPASMQFHFFDKSREAEAYDYMQQSKSKEVFAYLVSDIKTKQQGVLVLPWIHNGIDISDPTIHYDNSTKLIRDDNGRTFKVLVGVHTHFRVSYPSKDDVDTFSKLKIPGYILLKNWFYGVNPNNIILAPPGKKYPTLFPR
ncbi:leucine-rich repeat domain-containing protein [Hymenobacter terrenus]|uniref:leucine-rich repeat domain-containing protein n=1 Tax=Hymenobacter terrenus TaxID=1629124 RepID=UPI0009E60FAE|nr:RHS repeat-associated core domain-containing protein [Hymenobacter terrenus]